MNSGRIKVFELKIDGKMAVWGESNEEKRSDNWLRKRLIGGFSLRNKG